MKSIITSITLTAGLAVSLFAVRSGAEARATSIITIVQTRTNGGCSEATLNGSYGLLLNGTIFGRGLLGGVGVLTFDGEGNDTYAATQVTEDIGLQHVTSAGTYQVNPDCTGSLVNGVATFDFVIVDEGKELLQIATRADRVVTWVIKKQAHTNGGCSEATLNGPYGLLLNGTIFGRGLLGGAGVLTFDGEGNDTYAATQVTEDIGLQHVTSAGTYQVNSDCTGSLVNGPSTFDFVIVDEGKELLQIATRDDRVVTWVIKKQ